MNLYEEELQAINVEIQEEVDLWLEECKGVPNRFIEYDLFLMDTYLNALVSFLTEKDLIDEFEFLLAFKKRQLDMMRTHRPEIKKARLRELQRRLTHGAGRMDVPKGNLSGPS